MEFVCLFLGWLISQSVCWYVTNFLQYFSVILISFSHARVFNWNYLTVLC